MFEQYKIYKVKENMSLEEVIDKYSAEYYINLTFKPNGNVELFIGSEKAKRTATEENRFKTSDNE